MSGALDRKTTARIGTDVGLHIVRARARPPNRSLRSSATSSSLTVTRTEQIDVREELAAEVVDRLDRVLDQHLAGLVEQHVDDVALGRGDDDALHPLLALEFADVGGHHLRPWRCRR